MLPLSHIYVSTKVTKRKTPLLVFGSVLPDVSWTSKSEIGRDQIHYAPRELYEFISKDHPKFIDLALGVKLHSNIDRGADYYSDDIEHGFAKVEGKKIEDDVARLLGEEKGERTIGTAHNFIEAGVDILLNHSNPEVLRLYKKSVDEIDFEEISKCLADYIHKDKDVILGEINRFLKFVGPIAYSSQKDLTDRLLMLVTQRRGKEVDRNETEKILQESIEIMTDKYQSYLDNAVMNIKKDFADLL